MIATLIGVDFRSSGPEETSHGEYVYREDAEKVIGQLEAALIHQYNEDWDVGDGITDAAKVQFLIDRIPK